jgi:small subunit ribosomal protein S6
MIKHYEAVFIMTPVLSEDQAKETVDKFENFLKTRDAEIIYKDSWGLRKLAYPIQKKSTGFYYLIEFKVDGKIISELETTFRRDERILRFITVALDKHAIAYNEKKHKLKAEKAQKLEDHKV